MTIFDIQDNILKKATFNESINLYTIPQNVISIADGNETDYAFIDFKTRVFSINFEENCNIETIGKYAFNSCENLTSVDFTNAKKLKCIKGYAFRLCISLTSIHFPKSLEEILSFAAFSSCFSLESVTFPPESNLTTIESGAFRSCPLKKFVFPKKCQLDSGLGEAFENTSIEEFSVEDNYTGNIGIYEGSVYSPGFTKLYVYHKGPTFILHPNTNAIQYMPFAGSPCPHIIIPEGVTSFDSLAFFRFQGKKITMRSSPPRIDARFFYECPNLETIILSEGLEVLVKDEFSPINTFGALRSLYIPYSLKVFDVSSIASSDWRNLCFKGNVDIVKNQIEGTGYTFRVCHDVVMTFFSYKRRYMFLRSTYGLLALGKI